MIDLSTVQLNFLRCSRYYREIRPSHISLFGALVTLSLQQGMAVTFRITRKELMMLSAIRSFNTYHKCIQKLVELGFIIYKPSYDPISASQVSFNFDSKKDGGG